jgi:hypothetical protein
MRRPRAWTSWIAPSPGERRNRSQDIALNSPRSPESRETSGLRALRNRTTTREYGDESVSIEMEVAREAREVPQRGALRVARVVVGVRACPRNGDDRQLRGLCAARLTRISGCRPSKPVEGHLAAWGGFDDVAAGSLQRFTEEPAAVRKLVSGTSFYLNLAASFSDSRARIITSNPTAVNTVPHSM